MAVIGNRPKHKKSFFSFKSSKKTAEPTSNVPVTTTKHNTHIHGNNNNNNNNNNNHNNNHNNINNNNNNSNNHNSSNNNNTNTNTNTYTLSTSSSSITNNSTSRLNSINRSESILNLKSQTPTSNYGSSHSQMTKQPQEPRHSQNFSSTTMQSTDSTSSTISNISLLGSEVPINSIDAHQFSAEKHQDIRALRNLKTSNPIKKRHSVMIQNTNLNFDYSSFDTRKNLSATSLHLPTKNSTDTLTENDDSDDYLDTTIDSTNILKDLKLDLNLAETDNILNDAFADYNSAIKSIKRPSNSSILDNIETREPLLTTYDITMDDDLHSLQVIKLSNCIMVGDFPNSNSQSFSAFSPKKQFKLQKANRNVISSITTGIFDSNFLTDSRRNHRTSLYFV